MLKHTFFYLVFTVQLHWCCICVRIVIEEITLLEVSLKHNCIG
jgi:hypothetical protein